MLNNVATKSQSKAPTKQEVLDIIDTYEGMLRLNWDRRLLEERGKWVALLCRMEGR